VSASGEVRSYLVECYWPGVSAERLTAAAERARSAAPSFDGTGVSFASRARSSSRSTRRPLAVRRARGGCPRRQGAGGRPFERVLESLPIDGR